MASWAPVTDLSDTEVFWHHCLSYRCCNGWDKSVTVKRMRDVSYKLIFRRRPSPPAKSKWTKLGPCVDYFLLVEAIGELQADITNVTFKDLKDAAPGHDEGSVDYTMLEQISWHAVQGVRFREFCKHMNDDRVAVKIVAIVLEPVRYLTEFFLAAAKEQIARSTPMLLEFLDARRSPVVTSLQYLSAVLGGTSSRLVLLWAPAGYSNFAEWVENEQQDARST